MNGADFSATCEGCAHLITELWPKDQLCIRCAAPGRWSGRVIGLKRLPPYIPAWCAGKEEGGTNGGFSGND